MGNRTSQKKQVKATEKARFNKYGNDAFGAEFGTPGIGGMDIPTTYVEDPYEEVQWINQYIPTVRGGGKRPVIYVAAPLPAANQFGGGFGSGFGNQFGGGFGNQFGGGFGNPFGGGFGNQFGGGFGGFPSGFR